MGLIAHRRSSRHVHSSLRDKVVSQQLEAQKLSHVNYSMLISNQNLEACGDVL